MEAMLDVPIYGRIGTLELFRPYGEARDYLFIATERYKFCFLQCDPETSELVTRLIGLNLYDGLFKVCKLVSHVSDWSPFESFT
ncbi:hypothetical protein RIF29_29831 [Crotalaria pallida]|uniref:RSE1/DDB1/CPSF1 first beta-propeller domain-containing protein n=1 Tax=Crotalaria pallida TaxID=3830 RepID=A0AAN9HU88_CROPI